MMAPAATEVGVRGPRIWLLSDLHVESAKDLKLPLVDCDVVVLAGDIHTPGTAGVEWARGVPAFEGKPVLYVPGNHEFYRTNIEAQLRAMKAAAAGSSVHVMDRTEVTVMGVRFLGCMLWTDFMLPVKAPGGQREFAPNLERSLSAAGSGMYDYELIRIGAGRAERKLKPADTRAMHLADRNGLRESSQSQWGQQSSLPITLPPPRRSRVHRRRAVPRICERAPGRDLRGP